MVHLPTMFERKYHTFSRSTTHLFWNASVWRHQQESLLAFSTSFALTDTDSKIWPHRSICIKLKLPVKYDKLYLSKLVLQAYTDIAYPEEMALSHHNALNVGTYWYLPVSELSCSCLWLPIWNTGSSGGKLVIIFMLYPANISHFAANFQEARIPFLTWQDCEFGKRKQYYTMFELRLHH